MKKKKVAGRVLSRFSGFTLIEMITAAAIFSLLAVMLFSMVRSGLTMWSVGENARNDVERGVTVLDAIARELRSTFSQNDPLGHDPLARFQCDFVDFDGDGDGVKEGRVQRLRFTRINVEERENPALRSSGDQPLGDSGGLHTTLFDPACEASLPTAGLAEAAFMTYPSLKGMKGILACCRGYRTPVGGEDSFFAPGNLLAPEDIRQNLLPILEGVLYLAFSFPDPGTLLSGEEGTDAETLFTWDSTRSVLTADPGEKPNVFPYFVNRSSAGDAADDIFPSQVRVQVVVSDPLEEDRYARLTDGVRPEDLRIPVDLVKPFAAPSGEGRFVKIEGEWIEIAGTEGTDLKVVRRGVRHTLPAEHAPGSPVLRGQSLSTVVSIPAARNCWNDHE